MRKYNISQNVVDIQEAWSAAPPVTTAFLQTFLCPVFQCSIWHEAPQYLHKKVNPLLCGRIIAVRYARRCTTSLTPLQYRARISTPRTSVQLHRFHVDAPCAGLVGIILRCVTPHVRIFHLSLKPSDEVFLRLVRSDLVNFCTVLRRRRKTDDNVAPFLPSWFEAIHDDLARLAHLCQPHRPREMSSNFIGNSHFFVGLLLML